MNAKVDRGDDFEPEEEVKEVKDENAEAEVEETVDAEAADAGEEEKAEEQSQKEPMLPKSRYDSVKAKNKALEDRIAELTAKEVEKVAQQQTAEQDKLQSRVDELDDEINDALLDNDKQLAKTLRKEQRDLEKQLLRAEFEESSRKMSDDTRESIRLDITLASIEEAFPSLNPDDPESYNQELVDMVKELRDGYIGTGKYKPTDALLKSVEYILGDPAAAHRPSEQKKEAVADRKRTAVKKAVEASNKQPPSLKSVGDDADSGGMGDMPNINKLTPEEFEALPEATLRRMRGDSL